MTLNIRILDTRIGARMRSPAPTDVIAGSSTPLATILRRVTTHARRRRISRLAIYAHGWTAGVHDDARQMSRMAGGFGVDLGADGITFQTVPQFSALDGKFASGGVLEVHSCEIANDSPNSTSGLSGRGRRLLSELAAFANTDVRASEATQYFTHGRREFLFWDWYQGVDFGNWEGSVYLFKPDGSVRLERSNPTGP